jgi:signal peptidase I
MNRHVKSALGWIVYLAILVGLVVGTPKALSIVLETEYPMAAITSGSMWPALKQGDMVFIKGIKGKDEIEVGDVLVFQNARGFTIHRLHEKRADTVVTKGDANNILDSPVKYEDIIGKALEFRGKPVRIPWLGNVSILLGQ